MYDARTYFLFCGREEGERERGGEGICALTELDRGERPTSPRIDNNRGGTRNKKGDGSSAFFSRSRD